MLEKFCGNCTKFQVSKYSGGRGYTCVCARHGDRVKVYDKFPCFEPKIED